MSDDFRELQDHEKIQVGLTTYRVLSETNLNYLTEKYFTIAARELELENSDGQLFYLRLRHDGRWELEQAYLENDRWILKSNLWLVYGVGIEDYDDAVERSKEEENV